MYLALTVSGTDIMLTAVNKLSNNAIPRLKYLDFMISPFLIINSKAYFKLKDKIVSNVVNSLSLQDNKTLNCYIRVRS